MRTRLGDFDAADRFADIAGAVMRGAGFHDAISIAQKAKKEKGQRGIVLIVGV